MPLHARVAQAFDVAGGHAEKSATLDLRRRALGAGWPKSAVDSIQVHHTEGAFHASFNDEAADWEYGTEDRPPVAVARQWHNHIDDHAGSVLEEHLKTQLRDLL